MQLQKKSQKQKCKKKKKEKLETYLLDIKTKCQ